MSEVSNTPSRPHFHGRRTRFAVRTIRNGRVKILGSEWEPSREPCPERFEGMRAAFGLYWGPPNWTHGNGVAQRYDERGLMNGVSLWGSETAFRGEDDWPGPFCEDGTFKWEWWRRVEA